MSFVLTLTARELPSSSRRLLVSFLAIAIGVGSVVALRSLIKNLKAVVATDVRALLTADIDISSTNELSPAVLQKIESEIAAFGIVNGQSETMTAQVMARPSDPGKQAVKFVDLRGVTDSFPLVGEFRLADGTGFRPSLLANKGAVISQLTAEDLGVGVGEKIKIGENEFTINGIFAEEPGGTSGMRFAGRVYLERSAFDATGLAQTARVRRHLLFRTSGDPTALAAALRKALEGDAVTVASYREQQENLGEQFTRMEDHLALTGLLILVLGGIGIWNVARAFVEQKRKTIAILKCLGASGKRVIGVYLLQILALGLVGSLFGTLLAQGALYVVKWAFSESLPEKISASVPLETAFQGIFLGLAVSLLFSALPLVQIRTIRPKVLLHDANNQSINRLDRSKWAIGAAMIAGLLFLAVWQAGSFKVGAYFLVGLAAAAAVLYAAAGTLTYFLRKARRAPWFALRQAINSLHRPGNQTRVVLLTVGLGAFVVLGVQMIAGNLLNEFDLSERNKLPSLFFVDIQRSQVDEIAAMIESRTAEKPEIVAITRARLAYVNGEPIDWSDRDVRRQSGQIGREFAITSRKELEPNERVIDGRWWPERTDEPQVSVEQNMARRLKVTAGDSVTFEISGRPITARVANIRDVDLKQARTAFVFVFRPGTLETAPQTFAASILKHTPSLIRQKLLRAAVEAFPNVQVIDVDDVLTAVRKLIANFVLAISVIGGFVTLSGVMILIGSIALTKSQRVYEHSILKALGAGRRQLALMLFAEYAVVGSLAGLLGAVFAALMSWVVCRYLMDIGWRFDPFVFAVGVLATAALVSIVGVAASFDVLFQRPLATLRSQ
ncbi:MAG: putative ABC-type transport system involved in lysophospholipase L1 biosynthesis [Acidobacteria bacterium OLB17]|nr:MAG: putative ABC-type transport system involved in lysophospholipase L1 biosynthesis [Acidobacteria bacterium OLB17]MCZ2391209.1 ABC transporter permease [Acidobacteriota bacterium]